MELEQMIYVMPTEEGLPPRAIVGAIMQEEQGIAIAGAMATWNADTGVWMIEGQAVPEDMGEAITEHAKSLGVEW
jgi:hypothetical protein